MKEQLKRAARRLLNGRSILAVEFVCARLAFTVLRKRNGDRSRSVVVATNGRGNIGDQAMLEAYIANTTGAVDVVLSRRGDLSVPPYEHGRVRTVILPGHFDGRRLLDLAGMVRLARLLNGANSLAVIGADIMDGSYRRRESVIRLRTLWLAARRGVDARLLGFSWGASADLEATRWMRRLDQVVTLMVRDPDSQRRLANAGVAGTTAVADMVFSLPTAPPTNPPFPASWRDASRPLVLLNVSGLLASRFALVAEYVQIVRSVQEAGGQVAIVPHVVRPGDDDMAASLSVLEALADGSVYLARDARSVAAVQSLVSHASGVITGRMHLSILAMCQQVPAVVFSSQGKVSGLLQMLGVPHLEVEPGTGMAARVVDCLPELMTESESRRAIVSNLPTARSLSARNFARGYTANE